MLKSLQWPIPEIEEIRGMLPASYWDIRSIEALAEWLLSEENPVVIPGEMLASAKEMQYTGQWMNASRFFKGGWQEAEWFFSEVEDWKLARQGELPALSVVEQFIRIAPDSIGGDTWDWLEEMGAMDNRSAA